MSPDYYTSPEGEVLKEKIYNKKIGHIKNKKTQKPI